MLETKLPPLTKHICMVLRTHSNALGQIVWPSQRRLIKLTGMCERTLRTHLAKAVNAGWIRRVKLVDAELKIMEQLGRKAVKRKNAGKDWAACAYECCFPDRQQGVIKSQGQEMPPIFSATGARDAGNDRQEMPPLPILRNEHPNLKNPKENPLPPQPVDNGGKLGVVKNDKMGKIEYDVGRLLTDSGWLAARAAAPGWDIHRLVGIYNAGVINRGPPKNPAKAFVAWCKAYTKGIKL